MSIFYKNGKMLKIDRTQLSESANNTTIVNALYAAVYTEFFGAIDNLKYKDMTNGQRFAALNAFATQWLTDRGF